MARKNPPDCVDAAQQQSLGSSTQDEEGASGIDMKCCFLELPGEVRNMIYSYLVPHKETLNSRDMWSQHKLLYRLIEQPGIPSIWSQAASREYPVKLFTGIDKVAELHSQVFAVNKQISAEVLVLFLRSNTYEFEFHDHPHKSFSNLVSTSHPLGIFDFHSQSDLVCQLRKVRLRAYLSEPQAERAKCLRKRITWFVNTLEECHHDGSEESRLRELAVTYEAITLHSVFRPAFRREDKDLFCFEALAELTCVKEIKVEGLPDWFVQCLQLRIGKTGGPLKKASWKIKKTRRKYGYGKSRTISKTWWYPEYDWKEFAERNRITIPYYYEWLSNIK